MSYDVAAAVQELADAQKSLIALKDQGDHAPHCRAGEALNFDPKCNLCNAKKRYVQATADLAAAEAYADI